MHQPANKEVPWINFDQIGTVILEAEPKSSPPYRGVGKRSYIQLVVTTIGVGVEFYVERFVPPKPSQPAIGFTEDDVEYSSGVAIYEIHEDGDETNHRQYYGEVISIGDFMERYITSDTTRQILSHSMNTLDENSMLSDSFISNLNKIWSDRKVDTTGIYKANLC